MDQKTNKHLIFEGAEMVGKSFLISQIYEHLEKKDSSQSKILDGCHWFNCDVGVLGTENGDKLLKDYLHILKTLKNKNTIFEKFHLTHAVYQKIYQHQNTNFNKVDKKLKKENAKLILITVASEDVFRQRIPDRLKQFPYYQKILRKPSDYFDQQKEYISFFEQSSLKKIKVDFSEALNKEVQQKTINQILNFINE